MIRAVHVSAGCIWHHRAERMHILDGAAGPSYFYLPLFGAHKYYLELSNLLGLMCQKCDNCDRINTQLASVILALPSGEV